MLQRLLLVVLLLLLLSFAMRSCGPSSYVSMYVAPVDGTPHVVLQSFSSTADGPAATTFSASQAFYGRFLNLAADNAQSCMEVVGSTDGYCGTLANWTTLPNAEWTFDAPSGEWHGIFGATFFLPGQYRGFVRNTATGDVTGPVEITLTP